MGIRSESISKKVNMGFPLKLKRANPYAINEQTKTSIAALKTCTKMVCFKALPKFISSKASEKALKLKLTGTQICSISSKASISLIADTNIYSIGYKTIYPTIIKNKSRANDIITSGILRRIMLLLI
jgi:hypothetical protein